MYNFNEVPAEAVLSSCVRSIKPMAESWTTIESDPGVFTELIQQFGVKHVQVEELYSLEEEALQDLRPVYGLIFLFKWQSGRHEASKSVDDGGGKVFFASQVINNACATQAILSVLLNRPDLEIGPELRSLKEFTSDFPPDMRGEAISNSKSIRRAHNSFAPPEPIVSDESRATEKDDVFHFVSYVPVNGGVYELDGLQPGPVRIGDGSDDSWTDVARPHIMQRIEAYSKSEIRFNLMALVKNRATVAAEALEQAQALREALAASITPDADAGQQHHLQQVEREISRLQSEITAEHQKFENWRQENIRRRWNYLPLIFQMLQMLAEKKLLQPLIDKARTSSGPSNGRQQ